MKSNLPKLFLHPTTILVVTGILLILFAGFAILEHLQSQTDLISLMEEEGYVLLDALKVSSERSILAYEELEDNLTNRLLNSARWLRKIDEETQITESLLTQIAQEMDLFRIHMINTRGESVVSNYLADHLSNLDPSSNRIEYIQAFLKGSEDEQIIGYREGRLNQEPRYVVAVKRMKGGAIIVSGDARRLMALRKELGPGRLIQEIGSQPGVAYLLVQDSLGILMASKEVKEMSRIVDDPFLSKVYQKNQSNSRIIEYQESKVLEIAGRFQFEEVNLGLFRIGLKMEHFEAIQRKSRIRLVFLAVVFVFAGMVGLNFLVANQNLKLLSQSYRRVRTHTGEILQNMTDGVIAVDGKGIVTVFNLAAEGVFEISSPKIVGKQILSLKRSGLSFLKKSFEKKKALASTQQVCDINGKKKILSMQTSVVYGEDEKLDAVILVVSDMTEQKNLEDQLLRREKLTALGKLASGVAHEIRNPINAIGMIAQRFIKEFKPPDEESEFHEMAQSVVKETRRIENIIQQFLKFAKPAPLHLTSFNIEKFIEEIEYLMKSSARAKNITFKTNVYNKSTITVDKDQMKQALLNLLQNGIEAMEQGGRLELTSDISNREIIFAVSDSGSGIAKSVKDKIFDLYFSTKERGTGMGLAIAYQIVQAHGGEMTVESIEQKGTTFKIHIPKEHRA